LAAMLAVVVLAGWAPVSAAQPATERGSESLEPAPVVVWNREIVRFRTSFEGLAPATRAEWTERRILSLPTGLAEYRVEATRAAVGADTGVVILVNSTPVFGLLPADVDPVAGETLMDASERAAANLRAWIAGREEQLHWPSTLRGLLWSALATLLAAVSVIAVQRVARRLLRGIEGSGAARTRSLRIGRAEVGPYVYTIKAGLLRLAAWGIGAAVAYAWLTFVLHQFPYLRPWGQRLGGFILEVFRDLGLGMLHAIPNLFIVAVIFLITRLLTRVVTAFFRAAEAEWMHAEIARATSRLAVGLLWVFALVVAYPYLPGSGTAAFQGISVFVGLVVSLGSTGVMNQALGGLVIVYTRAFSVGDYVRVGEHEGTVTEVGALAVKVVTIRKEEVTIPHATVVGSSTVNYSRQARDVGAVVATEIGVGYDVPWRQVEALLLDAAARTDAILREPAPRVLKSELSNFYIAYRLLFHIARPEQRYAARSELHANILDAFNRHGVQIMVPAFEGQPEGRVVVPEDRWYAPPAVRTGDPPARRPIADPAGRSGA
jgi:small-conductance mechanosensitive channel